jgi:LPS O-antigen subunit length determinant protein (WzzB/FepE family)
MNRSESAEPKEQSGVEMSRQETSDYEDEINLMDYFLVLWKRKWFISLASVLPALVVGLVIFLGPRDYKISYTYNMELGEKTFKILENTFYSTENLEKLVEKLQASGFNEYAKKIAEARTGENLKELISFEVSPSYLEIVAPSKAKSFEELQKIQQVKGTLLVMAIVGNRQKDMYTISSIIRNDFEKIIPIYSVKDELTNNIDALKTSMAKIENDRFGLGLELERKKVTLEKLKNLKPEDLGGVQSNVILQFNMDASSAYMPLAYRIQAVNSQIINLEENIKANEERYNYHKGLLTVNEKLFDEVKSKIPLYYTIQEFHSFLDNIIKDYKDKELIDYLSAYIKSIENKMANTVPLIEKPKVYPVAKGTAKKSGIVFVVAFMISVFATFLLEGLKKSQTKVS